MKTAHKRLGRASAGPEYGHVPGNTYHDVDVVISTRNHSYRVHVVESWGSAQGFDEEHGRREAIGRGDSVVAAVADARDRAGRAGIERTDYLEQALGLAEDEAIEAELDAGDGLDEP